MEKPPSEKKLDASNLKQSSKKLLPATDAVVAEHGEGQEGMSHRKSEKKLAENVAVHGKVGEHPVEKVAEHVAEHVGEKKHEEPHHEEPAHHDTKVEPAHEPSHTEKHEP